MINLQRNKGSALLMVVGLMTIVVMLGITYLAIAHMDAKNSTIQMNNLQAGPTTDGTLVYFNQALVQALCIGANGPFSNYHTGGVAPASVSDWIQYTTSPSYWDNVKSSEVVYNEWLSSAQQDYTVPAGGVINTSITTGTTPWVWRTIGKLWKDDPSFVETSTTPGFVYNVTFTDAFSDAGHPMMIDADGDGVNDSRLFYSGITNGKGQKFYVAARAIDTSSGLCINTAGGVGGGSYCTVGAATANTLTDGAGAPWPNSCWNGGSVLLTSGGNPGMSGFVAANPIAPAAGGTLTSAGSTLTSPTAWASMWAPSGTKATPDSSCTYQILTDPHAVTPMSVDLNWFLGAASFSALHLARCGNSANALFTALPAYGQAVTGNVQGVASGLFSPIGSDATANPAITYAPFSMSDEMYLRAANVPADYTGRLTSIPGLTAKRALNGNSGSATSMTKDYLTTYSCTRSLLRIGSATHPQRISLYPTAAGTNDLDTPANQTALYTELAKFMPTPAQAAHLVANLWAASKFVPTAPGVPYTPTNAFLFAGGGVTAYGLVPQPFITEAVAAYVAPTDGTIGTAKELYAVEIRNYSGVTISLAQYNVGADSLAGSLAPGATLVIYYLSSGATLANFTGVPAIVGNSFPLTHPVDLSNGGVGGIAITRTVAGATIPVDSVLGTDIPNNLALTAVAALPTGQTPFFCAAKDDDPDRMRFAVHEYLTEPTPTLGASNFAVGAADPFPAGTMAGYRFFVGPMASIGNVGDLFVTGPEAVTGAAPQPDLPHNLLKQTNVSTGNPFAKDYSRGKVDFRAKVTSASLNYPDVPWGCLLAELIECAPTDMTRTDDTSRIYGRININTASADALSALPFPQYVYFNGTRITISPSIVASFIINYRDKTYPKNGVHGAVTTPMYTARTTATGITGLRLCPRLVATDPANGSDCPGFLTPGELAIPLTDYMHWQMGLTTPASESNLTPATVDAPGYLEARDALYKAVANCVTVNSDTFAVYVLVQLYPATVGQAGGPTPSGQATATGAGTVGYISQTRYLAVFDRSGCRLTTDKPAILLTAPLP